MCKTREVDNRDMTEIALIILVILLPFVTIFAFIAGYAIREYTARREVTQLDTILKPLMGMTAHRLNFEIDKPSPPTIDHVKPQNSIDDNNGVAQLTAPDLFKRREMAIYEEAKKAGKI